MRYSTSVVDALPIFKKFITTKKGDTMNKIGKTLTAIIGATVLAAATSGATLAYAEKQQKYTSKEQVQTQLEAITASGYFSVLDEYRNQQINQHPDQYMNELQAGAKVALRHAPNAVYQLAIDQYAEDVKEYFEARIYTMQIMTQKGGFSFNYDLNMDE